MGQVRKWAAHLIPASGNLPNTLLLLLTYKKLLDLDPSHRAIEELSWVNSIWLRELAPFAALNHTSFRLLTRAHAQADSFIKRT